MGSRIILVTSFFAPLYHFESSSSIRWWALTLCSPRLDLCCLIEILCMHAQVPLCRKDFLCTPLHNPIWLSFLIFLSSHEIVHFLSAFYGSEWLVSREELYEWSNKAIRNGNKNNSRSQKELWQTTNELKHSDSRYYSLRREWMKLVENTHSGEINSKKWQISVMRSLEKTNLVRLKLNRASWRDPINNKRVELKQEWTRQNKRKQMKHRWKWIM